VAVAITGSAVTNTTHGDGNQAVTIPADAEAVIVMSWSWVSNVANDFASLYWSGGSGTEFTSVVTNSTTSDPYDMWAYIMTDESSDWPGTGNQTLYWTFDSAPGEGGTVAIFFVKGLDTSDPVRDTDSEKDGAYTDGEHTWTASLSSVDADDLTICAVVDYKTRESATFGSGQTSLDSAVNDNSVDWEITYESGEGSPSVTDYKFGTQNDNYSGKVAFALKVASAAGGTTLTVGAHNYAMLFDGPVLSQGHNLTVGAHTYGMSFEAPNLSAGAISLVVDAIDFATKFDAPALTQVHNINVGAHEYSMSFEAPALNLGTISLVVDAIEFATQFDAPDVAQVHNILVDELAYAMGFDPVALTQRHSLSVDEITHALGFDAPNLSGKNTLSVAGLVHALGFDDLALTQAHTLAAAGLDLSMSFEAPILRNALTLSVDDLTHGFTVDGVVLTQAHVIQVDDLGFETDLGTIALSQAHLLALQELAFALQTQNVSFRTIDGTLTLSFSGDAVSITFAEAAVEVAFSAVAAGFTFTGE